jgi:hypothetical protein
VGWENIYIFFKGNDTKLILTRNSSYVIISSKKKVQYKINDIEYYERRIKNE